MRLRVPWINHKRRHTEKHARSDRFRSLGRVSVAWWLDASLARRCVTPYRLADLLRGDESRLVARWNWRRLAACAHIVHSSRRHHYGVRCSDCAQRRAAYEEQAFHQAFRQALLINLGGVGIPEIRVPR